MSSRFSYFVIFAGMRTGSNFLEDNLARFSGITCHGELFNPTFISKPKQYERFGMSIEEREADPLGFLARMRERSEGLPGFRFFPDHDPRVFAHVLADRSCAKIVLTRNPLDSFVSLEIARRTGQWKLGDMASARQARIRFDCARFQAHLRERNAFLEDIGRGLRSTGQAAFHIRYEDVTDLQTVNGAARYLGVEERKSALSQAVKKQNPRTLEERVENAAEARACVAELDPFGAESLASFEPSRGALVPRYVAARDTPLLFMPVKSAPDQAIREWLARLDDVSSTDQLLAGFSQKSLRQWKRTHPGHRSFTVIRHPVARLYHAFMEHIVLPGPENYAAIRETLTGRYGISLPKVSDTGALEADLEAIREAFLAFASFVRGNLQGQTSVRIDGAWATQTEILRGFSTFAAPDFIFREDELSADLAGLAHRFGKPAPEMPLATSRSPAGIDDIYDESVERAVQAAYRRDYVTFGFGPYSKAGTQAA